MLKNAHALDLPPPMRVGALKSVPQPPFRPPPPAPVWRTARSGTGAAGAEGRVGRRPPLEWLPGDTRSSLTRCPMDLRRHGRFKECVHDNGGGELVPTVPMLENLQGSRVLGVLALSPHELLLTKYWGAPCLLASLLLSALVHLLSAPQQPLRCVGGFFFKSTRGPVEESSVNSRKTSSETQYRR